MVKGIGIYNSSISYMPTQAVRSSHYPAEMFNKVDGDGELNADELKPFMKASGKMPSAPPPSGAIMMDGIESDDGSSTPSVDRVISLYDTNGDGALSSDELQKYLDNNMASFKNMMV